MCQLQFIKRLDKKNLTNTDIKEFFSLMTLGSLNNSDSFGFFNKDLFYKKKGLFNLKSFNKTKNLLLSNFLIGHNRFMTTSNNTENKNNHPLILNDFLLCHNGIINNYDELSLKEIFKKNVTTDSFIILHLIDKYFKDCKKSIRLDKIIYAIKRSCERLEGSFSVFLYDRIENNIFYFKNDNTEFKFYEIDNKYLCGSTDERNLNFIFNSNDFKKPKTKKINIKDNHIYLINDEFKFKDVEEFTPKIEKPINYYYKKYDYSEIENKINNKNNKVKTLKQDISFILDDLFGYTPKFKIKKGLLKLKNNNNYLLSDIKTLGLNYKTNNGFIEIDLNDFLDNDFLKDEFITDKKPFNYNALYK